jgi:aminoglycoside 6'-N-acetyltransferase I
VADLEALVAARGALTLLLGSDDELFETSLGGADLYHDLPSRLRDVRVSGEHAYDFYRAVGFQIVGVVPDANGRGKPDIIMAKRIEPTGGSAGQLRQRR